MIRSLATFALVVMPVLALPCTAQKFANWETPHVHPLELTPDGERLLAVNLPDNRLEVLDLTADAPASRISIPVGLDPVSVRMRSSVEAWVVNHLSDSVSIVDLSTGNVRATLDTDDEPCDVVFAGSPQRAFVSCSQANTVLVFDPEDLDLPPVRVTVLGEEPRAMGVSPNGDQVYVAVFLSGNGSTILGGGSTLQGAFPPNVVSDAAGPYGGVNPPPNQGAAFEPPIQGGLPAPPAVGLIVKRDDTGRWLDDNAGDWTSLVSGPNAGRSGRPVGWSLLDHDVVVIDSATLAVSYVDGLMNLCMGLGVEPASGRVAVVGSDSTNEVRFEPNLTGRFVRIQVALVDPSGLAPPAVVDLNPHLDYTTGTVPQSLRDQSLADPHGIAWNASGSHAYVTGMGSNNVVVLDATGARAGISTTIEVGEGPTGIVIDDARRRLYVLNKFEASISVVDTATEKEVARVAFHDPTPAQIRDGRKHLYDAHATSGLGITSCAACHVDARTDGLAWDLGDPAGDMKSSAGQNLGANVPGANTGFEDWHPMKGPMTTQTLQDIIGKEPHHWRGDRDGLEEFADAFAGLLGDDAPLGSLAMQEFEDFLATVRIPPNPYRDLDNGLPSRLPLPGHFTPGRFGPPGLPLPDGNAQRGLRLFRPPNTLDLGAGGIACVTCHTLPTGLGTNRRLQGNRFRSIPVGPNGERHHALVSTDEATNVTIKVPQLRTLYEKGGLELTQPQSTAGFGFLHDGSIDSLARFVSEPVFTVASVRDVADLVAFLLCFAGGDLPFGTTTNLLEPRGSGSKDTHAAVGRQVTFADGANPDPADVALLDALIALAEADAVGLVAKGVRGDEGRGWFHLGGERFQADRRGEVRTRTELLGGAGPGTETTFTVVPFGSGPRIGVDRDGDRALDGDERDAGTDPADPTSRPKTLPSKGLSTF